MNKILKDKKTMHMNLECGEHLNSIFTSSYEAKRARLNQIELNLSKLIDKADCLLDERKQLLRDLKKEKKSK